MRRLWLSITDEEFLLREAAERFPNETGGVLMGYRGEGGDLVVTAVLGPGPDAIHRPTSLVPDHVFHEEEIARLYEASGRRHQYLGDWHSHPGGSCALSRTDRRTLHRIARTPEARVPEPLMLVMGGGISTWRLCVHQVRRGPLFRTIHALRIVSFG